MENELEKNPRGAAQAVIQQQQQQQQQCHAHVQVMQLQQQQQDDMRRLQMERFRLFFNLFCVFIFIFGYILFCITHFF